MLGLGAWVGLRGWGQRLTQTLDELLVVARNVRGVYLFRGVYTGVAEGLARLFYRHTPCV
jgi:hypothetical protein